MSMAFHELQLFETDPPAGPSPDSGFGGIRTAVAGGAPAGGIAPGAREGEGTGRFLPTDAFDPAYWSDRGL